MAAESVELSGGMAMVGGVVGPGQLVFVCAVMEPQLLP